ASADVVLGPGQQRVVGADLVVAHAEVVLAGGHLVEVQQDLLGGEVAGGVGGLDGERVHARTVLATGVHRIVLAGGVARVVPPAVVAVRHRAVVLPDAAHDLRVQLFLQRPQRPHHRIDIGVLRLQVGQHRRILAAVVAQPVVLVLAGGAERRGDLVRLAGGVGRVGGDGGGGRGHQQGGCKQERQSHRSGPDGGGGRPGTTAGPLTQRPRQDRGRGGLLRGTGRTGEPLPEERVGQRAHVRGLGVVGRAAVAAFDVLVVGHVLA